MRAPLVLLRRTIAIVLLLAAGLTAARCGPEDGCGDGVVDVDEVCDDGVNDGRYDGCMPSCQAFGPRCGDGVVDAEEACDDGFNNGRYGGCAPDCLSPEPRCGDGIITPLRPLDACRSNNSCCGERCDDSDDDGSDGLRCGACVVRSSGVLSGCDALQAPPLDLTVTSPLGTSTLTRAYFGEFYGDTENPTSVTGATFRFVEVTGDITPGELPVGPMLTFEPTDGDFCVSGGVPSGSQWGGAMTGAVHVVGGVRSTVGDLTLVIDGMDPDTMLLHGRLEGAVNGTFTAAYCDELVSYHVFSPD